MYKLCWYCKASSEGASNKGGVGKQAIFELNASYLENGKIYVHITTND